MRFINTSSIVVPPNWLSLAKISLGNNHRSLWSYFKRDLERIVLKKCWFSESINIGADNDVEHFRPKAIMVKELKKKNADLEAVVWNSIDSQARDGYSYLEFEFSNYRYSCVFVNSSRKGHNSKVRGKSNFFPLKLNSPYSTSIVNLNSEIHCLLDPCDSSDPQYLTFNDLGEIVPNITVINGSWVYCRVMVSIEIYHLHYYRFRESRLQIWDSCKQNIEMANKLQASLRTQLEIESFKLNILELNKKIDAKSEFSAVAIDCIRFYKVKYTWLDKFFPNANLVK